MRRTVSAILCLALVLTLAAVAGSAESKTYTLRFNTTNVPESATFQSMQAFKEALEKNSNGQVKVELYHSGSLYTEDGQYDALANGDLEMIWTDQFWLANRIPYLSMLTAGYAFKSYEHMNKVLCGEIGQEIFDDVAEELGIRPLSAYYFGSRQLSLRKGLGKTVQLPEDMATLNFRMPNTAAYLFLGRALGTNPTPMALTEVYMGLSTGAIDGQDNPLPTLYSNSFYEVTESITLTHHTISSIWPSIREDIWQDMDKDLQAKVLEAVAAGKEACDTYVLNKEAELVDTFKNMGITIIEPDIDAWINHVQAFYLADKEMTSAWDMDLYERMRAID